MKKSLWMLLVLFCAAGTARAEGYWGGFWHMGGQVFLNPQTALNQELQTLGYNGFTGTGYGMTFGGGGLINNFFLGGWGSWDFNSHQAVNTSAQRTLSGGTGGRGGFELGYAVLNIPKLHLIPSLNIIWGGSDYTFTTNMSFTDYVNNPVDFSPGFAVGNISLGLGVNLLAGGAHGGMLIKAVYMYSLNSGMGPVNFTSGPELSPHSVMLTFEYYTGGILTRKHFSNQDKLVPPSESIDGQTE